MLTEIAQKLLDIAQKNRSTSEKKNPGHDLLSGLRIDRAKAEDKLIFNISHKSREYLDFDISCKKQKTMIATIDTNES